MHLVLVEPEIAPNVGNVARLCAATRTTLHVVEPLGFELDDARLRRAGMDYWRHVIWHRWSSWKSFSGAQPQGSRFWFVESGGPRHYAEPAYGMEDYLVFGRETAGLPLALVRERPEQWLRIPMFHSESRSLNLSNCAAVVLYEALRQQGFGLEVL